MSRYLVGIYFSVFLLILGNAAAAQNYAAPVWVFGDHAGLDFNSGAPVPFESAMFTHSSKSATQCDDAGNILFYANGFNIWDKAGNVMAGSQNPVWPTYLSGYSMQTIIVPDGTDMHRFFVFDIFPSDGNPPYGAAGDGALTYTIVDMQLNGGNGGVLPGMNHVLLDNAVGDYMAVIPDDQCSYWLIVHSGPVHTFKFRAYKISAQGVAATPVTSSFAFIASNLPAFPFGVDNRMGNMVYSYTRNKLFVSYNAGDLYAYDFNPASGVVSNPQSLGYAYAPAFPASASLPGICLSPDENQLYMCGYTGGSEFQLRQYPVLSSGANITLGTPVTLFSPGLGSFYTNIEQTLPLNYWETNMQIGPDNKIYITYTLGKTFLGCINKPDLPGIACDFNPDGIALSANTFTTSALPSPAVPRRKKDLVASSTIDLKLCFEPSALLTAPDDSYDYYRWHNGQVGKELTATASGMYILSSSDNSCRLRLDTFNLSLVDFSLSLGADLEVCDSVLLTPQTNAVMPIEYLWSTGSAAAAINVFAPGSYWVELTKEGCSKMDTVNIGQASLLVDLGNDTTICLGDKLVLNAYNEGASYSWQDGSTGATHDADEAGHYTVAVTKGQCAAYADIDIETEVCNCSVALPSAFSPNKDGRNDIFKPVITPGCSVKNYQLSIYNRYGQLVFSSFSAGTGWDGSFMGQAADLGTYMYQLQLTGPREQTKTYKGDLTLIR